MTGNAKLTFWPNGGRTFLGTKKTTTTFATSQALVNPTATAPGSSGKTYVTDASGLTLTLPTTVVGSLFNVAIGQDGHALSIKPTSTEVGITYNGSSAKGLSMKMLASNSEAGAFVSFAPISSTATTGDVVRSTNYSVVASRGLWTMATATGL